MVSQNERKHRISQIQDLVKKSQNSGKNILKERLIGQLCCDWGAARRTILEYLNNLASAEYVKEAKSEEGIVLIWNGSR